MKLKPLLMIISLIMISLLSNALETTNLRESELISISKEVRFTDAVKIFDVLYRQHENKVLIDMSEFTDPIGIEIDKLHWKAALHSILKRNSLHLSERDNAFIVRKDTELTPDAKIEYQDDVLIEVTFFEADFNVVRELGIDWSSFVDGEVRISGRLRTTDQLTDNIFSVDFDRRIEAGSTTIDINTLFRALSANDKGHIISRPQITVVSGQTASVQDGIDYTILVPGRTALGDEIEQAHEVNVQSGTIVNVTPEIFLDDEREKAIKLTVRVERSTAQPDVTGFSKRTSEVNSQKILYSGEETIIGGLTTKETVHIRKGIPILKDLPWWVFGIRYLTGFSRSQLYSKELIIIIKASILPSVHERRNLRRDVSEEIEHKRRQLPEIEPKLIP